MNNSLSGEELLREMDADRARLQRRYWIWFGSVCAVAIVPTVVLWLIGTLT